MTHRDNSFSDEASESSRSFTGLDLADLRPTYIIHMDYYITDSVCCCVEHSAC